MTSSVDWIGRRFDILDIFGLGMSLIVLGRGIDLSMVATLAVPPGLLLKMVQDGYSVPTACVAALGLALVFGLTNGWLIAYAKVPPLFTTLGSGILLAGLGQAVFFQLDVVQWRSDLDMLSWFGRGTFSTVPMLLMMFALPTGFTALFLKKTQLGALAIGDNPFSARDDRHSGATCHCTAIRDGRTVRCLRGHREGGLRQQHAGPHLQFDAHLRCHPSVDPGRYRSGRRPTQRRTLNLKGRYHE